MTPDNKCAICRNTMAALFAIVGTKCQCLIISVCSYHVAACHFLSIFKWKLLHSQCLKLKIKTPRHRVLLNQNTCRCVKWQHALWYNLVPKQFVSFLMQELAFALLFPAISCMAQWARPWSQKGRTRDFKFTKCATHQSKISFLIPLVTDTHKAEQNVCCLYWNCVAS